MCLVRWKKISFVLFRCKINWVYSYVINMCVHVNVSVKIGSGACANELSNEFEVSNSMREYIHTRHCNSEWVSPIFVRNSGVSICVSVCYDRCSQMCKVTIELIYSTVYVCVWVYSYQQKNSEWASRCVERHRLLSYASFMYVCECT